MASSSKCITGKLKRIVATAIAAILSVGLVSYYPIVKNDNYGIVVEAYSNGNYKVNTASGINVRTGAGTGYSKAGAATNGTSFTVDQISGSWGHTSSIKCTNGTKSGWVCLDYCRQTSTSSSGSSNVSSFQAATYKVNTSSGLNVRTGAGTNYSKKTAVKNGTYLYITSKSGDWGYASNYGGYVSMKYTAFVSNSNLTSGSGASSGVSTAVNIISNYTNYSTPLSNGTAYFITPACATGNVIDVSNSGKNNGTNILSWSKHGGTNQQFKAVYLSNGYYTFYNVNSGKVIDVSGGIVANGTNIQIYEYNGTASQQWRLISAGNGYYYLQSKLNSSYYLDVSGASSSNGANVQLYKGNASNAQKFRFTNVPNPKPVSNNGNIQLSVPSYKQGDARWKNKKIGTRTIGSVGCIITSVAMAYSYNSNSVQYPDAVKNRLRFANNSIYWDSVSSCGMKSYSKGGVQINQSIMKEIYNKLVAGRPVVIWCQNSKGNAHAVCVTGYNGSTSNFSASNFTINDPGYSRTNLQQHLNYVDKVYYLIY